MDKIIYKNRYVIHFELIENRIVKFSCYPIIQWVSRDRKKDGYSYISFEDYPSTLDEFDEKKAVKKLQGEFDLIMCDDYMVFPDEDYDGEEFTFLHQMYHSCILPHCNAYELKNKPKQKID